MSVKMPSLTTYAINTDNKVTAVKAACCVQQSEIMSSSLHTHIHTHAHAHTQDTLEEYISDVSQIIHVKPYQFEL